MARINLTLSDDTESTLMRHAKRRGLPRAALARECIEQSLAAVEAAEQRHRLAQDYVAGRADGRSILAQIEAAQLELLDEEAT